MTQGGRRPDDGWVGRRIAAVFSKKPCGAGGVCVRELAEAVWSWVSNTPTAFRPRRSHDGGWAARRPQCRTIPTSAATACARCYPARRFPESWRAVPVFVPRGGVFLSRFRPTKPLSTRSLFPTTVCLDSLETALVRPLRWWGGSRSHSASTQNKLCRVAKSIENLNFFCEKKFWRRNYRWRNPPAPHILPPHLSDPQHPPHLVP